jgi:uncharacterized short protein YbdD (DUF466 family)
MTRLTFKMHEPEKDLKYAKFLNTNFAYQKKLNRESGLLISKDYIDTVPYIDNLIFFNENELYLAEKTLEKLNKLISGLKDNNQDYEQFLEKKPENQIMTFMPVFSLLMKPLKLCIHFLNY